MLARSPTAIKQAEYRARKAARERKGLAVYHITVHRRPLLKALTRSGMPEEFADDPERVAAEIAALLEAWAENRNKLLP